MKQIVMASLTNHTLLFPNTRQYLSTISRVRTEKEEELLALENYWKERLATQEAETVHRQKLTEQEVI